ncbi:hypothetical protein JI75_06900 [Berryella intestinalis]|uniref:Uncharacterized protein n=1 Tax=Berryella intestinalis TaxID=1531429 RepID=A0A0A8B6G5_9ACTN|nr:hypothetical protein [Berryella intestinalis]AJC12428.1 hypothetical protein JI75_06900 [Berryella intestinalis]
MSKRNPKKDDLVIPAEGEVLYGDDGLRIGDDGYPMTPMRTAEHRLLDIILIIGYIFVVVAVVLVVLALFQGQDYDTRDFSMHGGAAYKGLNLALLMRCEALVVFVLGLTSVFISHRGFNWLYDNDSLLAVRRCMLIQVALSFAWNVYLWFNVQLVDPFTGLVFLLSILHWLIIVRVIAERPGLTPSKFSK